MGNRPKKLEEKHKVWRPHTGRVPVRNPNKDRTLAGKKRIRARKAAQRAENS